MFFDTHCHIYDEQFEGELENIIQRAINNKVNRMLLPSDSLLNAKKCIKIANTYENIFAAIGIHPSDVFSLEIDATIGELKKLFESNKKICAIGEIGLDYYWYKDEESKEIQKKWFDRQITLANELELPIIVHCRDAFDDTLKILNDNKPRYGCVFHCFSGSQELLKECLKRGYYIGLDGPVTYKNAITPKLIASEVPLDRLFLETDSPYLTPTPHRGQRNEPSYLIHIAEEIAKLKNITIEEVAKITTDNACRFFNIGELQ